jgi:hypothetical protein
VKKSGELEKARVHWHAVAYAIKLRANGHVETILPERGVFCKMQNLNSNEHGIYRDLLFFLVHHQLSLETQHHLLAELIFLPLC